MLDGGHWSDLESSHGFQNVPAMPEFRQPTFKLTPPRMELKPGESTWMTVEGLVTEPKEVRERLLCHSIIGRQGGKELIMKVDLFVEFISPLLEFSNDTIFFRFDKVSLAVIHEHVIICHQNLHEFSPLQLPDAELETQMQTLTLTNISSLPLTVNLELKYPFAMMFGAESSDDREITTSTEAKITLAVRERYDLRLQFDPTYKDDFHIRTADEVLKVSYDEHPHIVSLIPYDRAFLMAIRLV